MARRNADSSCCSFHALGGDGRRRCVALETLDPLEPLALSKRLSEECAFGYDMEWDLEGAAKILREALEKTRRLTRGQCAVIVLEKMQKARTTT